MPRSIPSTTGISTGYTENYEGMKQFEKVDEEDYQAYMEFKKDNFKNIQDPIFIANKGISDPPNISSDEE